MKRTSANGRHLLEIPEARVELATQRGPGPRRSPRARRARAAQRRRSPGTLSAARVTAGATSCSPAVIAPSRSPSTSCSTPPPSSTSTGSFVRSSRVSATRASATTSDASRCTISAATASSADSARTSGASSITRRCSIAADVDRLRQLAAASPARSAPGTARSRLVRGPRPSSLRAAAETAARPRS